MSMSKGPCGPAVELRKIACGKHSITYIFHCPSYRGPLSCSHTCASSDPERNADVRLTVRQRTESPCTNHEDCDSAAAPSRFIQIPVRRNVATQHVREGGGACIRAHAPGRWVRAFFIRSCPHGSCRDDGTPPVTRTKMSFDTAQGRVQQESAHDVPVVRASFYVPAGG